MIINSSQLYDPTQNLQPTLTPAPKTLCHTYLDYINLLVKNKLVAPALAHHALGGFEVLLGHDDVETYQFLQLFMLLKQAQASGYSALPLQQWQEYATKHNRLVSFARGLSQVFLRYDHFIRTHIQAVASQEAFKEKNWRQDALIWRLPPESFADNFRQLQNELLKAQPELSPDKLAKLDANPELFPPLTENLYQNYDKAIRQLWRNDGLSASSLTSGQADSQNQPQTLEQLRKAQMATLAHDFAHSLDRWLAHVQKLLLAQGEVDLELGQAWLAKELKQLVARAYRFNHLNQWLFIRSRGQLPTELDNFLSDLYNRFFLLQPTAVPTQQLELSVESTLAYSYKVISLSAYISPDLLTDLNICWVKRELGVKRELAQGDSKQSSQTSLTQRELTAIPALASSLKQQLHADLHQVAGFTVPQTLHPLDQRQRLAVSFPEVAHLADAKLALAHQAFAAASHPQAKAANPAADAPATTNSPAAPAANLPNLAANLPNLREGAQAWTSLAEEVAQAYPSLKAFEQANLIHWTQALQARNGNYQVAHLGQALSTLRQLPVERLAQFPLGIFVLSEANAQAGSTTQSPNQQAKTNSSFAPEAMISFAADFATESSILDKLLQRVQYDKLYLQHSKLVYKDPKAPAAGASVRAGTQPETAPSPAQIELTKQVLFHFCNFINAAVDTSRYTQQQVAIAGSLDLSFSTIIGGPGTGKTTTVFNILLIDAVLHLMRNLGSKNPLPLIALAAPTGKASEHLRLSIVKKAQDLLNKLDDKVSSAKEAAASFFVEKEKVEKEKIGVHLGAREFNLVLDHLVATGIFTQALRAIINAEGKTLHKLLGSSPGEPQGIYARNPVAALATQEFVDSLSPNYHPADIIIVDEIGMVNNHLLEILLRSVSLQTRMIWLGDADQLPAIGVGNFLADLSKQRRGYSQQAWENFARFGKGVVGLLGDGSGVANPAAVNASDDLAKIAPENSPAAKTSPTYCLSDCLHKLTKSYRYKDYPEIEAYAVTVNDPQLDAASVLYALTGPQANQVAPLLKAEQFTHATQANLTLCLYEAASAAYDEILLKNLKPETFFLAQAPHSSLYPLWGQVWEELAQFLQQENHNPQNPQNQNQQNQNHPHQQAGKFWLPSWQEVLVALKQRRNARLQDAHELVASQASATNASDKETKAQVNRALACLYSWVGKSTQAYTLLSHWFNEGNSAQAPSALACTRRAIVRFLVAPFLANIHAQATFYQVALAAAQSAASNDYAHLLVTYGQGAKIEQLAGSLANLPQGLQGYLELDALAVANFTKLQALPSSAASSAASSKTNAPAGQNAPQINPSTQAGQANFLRTSAVRSALSKKFTRLNVRTEDLASSMVLREARQAFKPLEAWAQLYQLTDASLKSIPQVISSLVALANFAGSDSASAGAGGVVSGASLSELMDAGFGASFSTLKPTQARQTKATTLIAKLTNLKLGQGSGSLQDQRQELVASLHLDKHDLGASLPQGAKLDTPATCLKLLQALWELSGKDERWQLEQLLTQLASLYQLNAELAERKVQAKSTSGLEPLEDLEQLLQRYAESAQLVQASTRLHSEDQAADSPLQAATALGVSPAQFVDQAYLDQAKLDLARVCWLALSEFHVQGLLPDAKEKKHPAGFRAGSFTANAQAESLTESTQAGSDLLADKASVSVSARASAALTQVQQLISQHLLQAPILPHVFNLLKNTKFLAPVRSGQLGVDTLNQELARIFPAVYPIQITVNDAAQNVFNGDIGIVLPAEHGAVAYFDKVGSDGRYHSRPLQYLKDYEQAFFTTVHKSQGDEFENTYVVLSKLDSFVSRPLYYTAITRTKRRLKIFAGADLLTKTSFANEGRRSSLEFNWELLE